MRQMATLARCVWYQAFEERPVSVRGRWVEVLDNDINMKYSCKTDTSIKRRGPWQIYLS